MTPLQSAFKKSQQQQAATKTAPVKPKPVPEPKTSITPELQHYVDLLHEANKASREEQHLKDLIASKLGLKSL